MSDVEEKPRQIVASPSPTKRTFAAHFILDGPVNWENTSGMGGRNLPDHSLTLYLSPSWRSPKRREVFRFVATELVKNCDWFSLHDNRWRVDYDKLSAFAHSSTSVNCQGRGCARIRR